MSTLLFMICPPCLVIGINDIYQKRGVGKRDMKNILTHPIRLAHVDGKVIASTGLDSTRRLCCPVRKPAHVVSLIGHDLPAVGFLQVPVISFIKAFQLKQLRVGQGDGLFIDVPIDALRAGRGR